MGSILAMAYCVGIFLVINGLRVTSSNKERVVFSLTGIYLILNLIAGFCPKYSQYSLAVAADTCWAVATLTVFTLYTQLPKGQSALQ